jgi:hypothetical protein
LVFVLLSKPRIPCGPFGPWPYGPGALADRFPLITQYFNLNKPTKAFGWLI